MRFSGSRVIVVVGVVVVAAVALSSCSSSGSSSAPSGTSGSKVSANVAPATVTVAEIRPTASWAASYAARGTGAIAAVEKKFHTKIKFTQLSQAIDTVNAMLGGTADMSLSALTAFLTVAGSGKKVTTTFAPFVGGGGVLIGAKRYEKTRGSDLAKYGKDTFGYTREGSASQVLMKLAAEKAGVNWNGVKHVAFGMPSAGAPLLNAGRIAIAAVDPTTAAQAVDSGQAYVVLNFSDTKIADPIVGQQLATVYGFTTSFTQKYPALTKAIVGAFAQGLNAVKKVASDPAAVLKLFPASIQAVLSNGWASAWALTAPGIVACDGSQPTQAVKDTVSFAEKAGLLTTKQGATAGTVVNNSYLP